MKKLSNIETDLRKSIAYKKSVYFILLSLHFVKLLTIMLKLFMKFKENGAFSYY